MICPKCGAKLVERRTAGGRARVDLCPGCKGMWFDAGELEAVLEVAAKELGVPSGAKRSDMSCPRCRRALFAYAYPQTLVMVDMCKSCGGLWLDVGEIGEIKALREAWRKDGTLEEHAPVPGVKGALVRFVDSALEALRPW